MTITDIQREQDRMLKTFYVDWLVMRGYNEPTLQRMKLEELIREYRNYKPGSGRIKKSWYT